MREVDFSRTLTAIQMNYVEMPDLKLTLGQVSRLWALSANVSRTAVDVLVAAGFLEVTADGAYRRRGTPPVEVERIDSLTWAVSPHPGMATVLRASDAV